MHAQSLIRLITIALLLTLSLPAHAAPSLVVLAGTGQTREGVPVLQRHPDEQAILQIAEQGFGATVLRLYQFTQIYLERQGRPSTESAYMLLKPGSGGFPRTGFYLEEEDYRTTDYAEVAPNAGYTEAVRIFFHELNHTMVLRLAGGDHPRGPSTQMHGVGIRTNGHTAWSEGFAISFETMFVEAMMENPLTSAAQQEAWEAAQSRLERYRSALGAPFSPATFTRMGFRSWFPATEQVLRYHAVKANGYARQPAIPERLLQRRNLYGAYLLENVLPGAPGDPPKSAQRMLQTEGVVAALFYRWAMDEGLQTAYQSDGFYTQFGTTRAEITPVENVYLKLFHALAEGKPGDAAAVIAAYKRSFPEEAPLVDRVVAEVLLGQPLPNSPEIWLANPCFKVGMMIFDQFRQVSQIHTFDLNGASLVDLLGVPGVDRQLAEEILGAAPFASLEDLAHVDGMTPVLMERFRSMAQKGEGMAEGNAAALLLAFGGWLLFIGGLGGLLGGALYRTAVKRAGWGTALLNGFAAALLCLFPFWFLGAWAQILPLLLPALAFGGPAALWALWRKRDSSLGKQKLLGWALAPWPAFALLVLRMH